MSITKTYKPLATTDDGYKYKNSATAETYTFTSYIASSLIGNFNGGINSSQAFIRFPNVDIPKGSIIESAALNVCATNDNATTVVNFQIYACDYDNAVAPTDVASFDALVKGTEVDWNNVPAFTANTWYTSPDISSLVQAIVNRSGWASGNALMLKIEGLSVGTDVRRIISNYGNYTYPNTEPQLVITYSEATTKTQIGTYNLMGKSSIINIPLYDPAIGMDGKNMLRTFLSDGRVGCFELQDITGTELIRVMGKTKIRGVKI